MTFLQSIFLTMASREAGMGGMAAVRNIIYNNLIRRTSVYVTACVFGGIVCSNAYFRLSDSVWGSINKGVRILPLPVTQSSGYARV